MLRLTSLWVISLLFEILLSEKLLLKDRLEILVLRAYFPHMANIFIALIFLLKFVLSKSKSLLKYLENLRYFQLNKYFLKYFYHVSSLNGFQIKLILK